MNELTRHTESTYRHSNGDVDFANGDRIRWCNGWWIAARKGGNSTKHITHAEAEAALGHKSDEEKNRE